MNKKIRVVCAMSGGVDSSAAAAILKNQGFEVVGVFMKLWSDNNINSCSIKENICCSVDAANAARAVARKLNIPFYVIDLQEEFKKAVVDDFISECEAGRTPNPCVICNRDIKGKILLNKVKELDGDYLATGHYMRIASDNIKCQMSNVKQNYKLLKGKDENKDQSYFLWTLTQDKLSKLLFPVGNMTKPEVRELAKKMKLPTAERRESQGICFIPDRDVAGFLKRYGKKLNTPGPICTIDNKKIGTHEGLINYTIGQREGLGLGGPIAYYVVKLDSKRNTLVVGDEKDLFSDSLVVRDVNWIVPNDKYQMPNVKATIRYGHPAEKCSIKAVSCKLLAVSFLKPQRAVTPGQSIVFYKNNELIGGGIIDNSHANNEF